MKIVWNRRALADIRRLHDFIAPHNPIAAARIELLLANSPAQLIIMPRLGEQLEEFLPREVRRLIVEKYELRYRVQDDIITIIRIYHGREDR